MKVLQITAHFYPNVGGVETHLDNLVKALIKRDFQVFVLTYRPLTTETAWNVYEKNNGVEIFRIPWLPNLFYKLVAFPMFEFLYLLPGLFFTAPFVILSKNPDVIHAHGLVAGFVGVFWGKLFGKKVVISTHSIYHFPKKGLYKNFISWIFANADYSLGLSKQAEGEIKSLGISKDKVDHFTYWIDLEKFKVQSPKSKVKRELGLDEKFTVLFVGRLVREKGVIELLQSAKIWDKNITLVVVGSGPLEVMVSEEAAVNRNIKSAGITPQERLPLFYCAADILIVPSISEEGFGRVILESLACSTPVIGARRGAIPEAMDETVGKLIDATPENIKKAVEYFYKNRGELKKMSLTAREFAERRYSESNVEKIIKAYTK